MLAAERFTIFAAGNINYITIMKKTIFFILLVLMGLSQATAQDYEYVPFVREGVKWVYYYTTYHGTVTNDYRTLELKGDTVINGKTYKAMHKYSGNAINWECDTVPVYLREENRVVYGIIPDGRFYSDCPVYGIIDINQEGGTPRTYNGEEFVLYDFQNPVAYWDSIYDYFNSYGGEEPIPYRQLRADMIVVGGHLAKRYSGEFLREFQLIEGIGQVAVNSTPLYFGLGIVAGASLRSNPVYDSNFYLSHVIEDGGIVYKTEYYIQPEPEDYEYVPIVREGVKWVNEKVIVDHGDTTRYYYNYEIRGNYDDFIEDGGWPGFNGMGHKACFYYKRDELDVNTDSLIAGLRGTSYSMFCGRNRAYDAVNHIFRLGFFGNERWMYYFYEDTIYDGTSIEGIFTIADFYIGSQEIGGYTGVYPRDPYLTHENFTKTEPVVIEGVTCQRWSIVGENGDTLAYVVEGIGFDSYDMGDLLTPFTRRPDPAADHQEWCGLSHVIKDGQIIYKGMRYRKEHLVGIDEAVADKPRVVLDPNYYNLMGQPVGREVPTTPGIYIHQGKKICVSR